MIVCRDLKAAEAVHSAFGPPCRVDTARDNAHALDLLKKRPYEIIFIDLGILQGDNKNEHIKESLHLFWAHRPSVELIVISQKETIRDAVRAVKAGAGDYLTYPIDPEEVKLVAKHIQEATILESELEYLREQQWKSEVIDFIRTNNPAMKQVLRNIRSVSPTKTTVLLVGETGVGKGVVAKLVHLHSNRENAQFISVHCGAIPETLVESELFGHEKGAFTGAVRKKLGKFEIAHDGTIFLDEIGTITQAVQIKLLQVLQDGTYSRVGGEEVLRNNSRIIAATNSDLKQMSDQGVFRKDLFYRLNVFPIHIPPLRERKEDIPFFIEIFLKRLNRSYMKEIDRVHPQVLEALSAYSWPGNIRELENLIERAYILEPTSQLTPESFPSEFFEDKTKGCMPINTALSMAEARRLVVEEFERRYLENLITRNKGKIKISAEQAGIGPRQMHKLMLKYGLRKEVFKG
jgi:DNA-binding NtrC family response regulator